MLHTQWFMLFILSIQPPYHSLFYALFQITSYCTSASLKLIKLFGFFTDLPTSSAMCSKCHELSVEMMTSEVNKINTFEKSQFTNFFQKLTGIDLYFSEIHLYAHTGEREGRNALFYVPISTCRSRIPNALIRNRNC